MATLTMRALPQKEGSSYTIEEYLSDKGTRPRFGTSSRPRRRCGEFQFAPEYPQRLDAQAMFGSCTPSNRGCLRPVLASRHSTSFRRSPVRAHEYFHHVRVGSLDELDDELGELICLAYQWGLVGAK